MYPTPAIKVERDNNNTKQRNTKKKRPWRVDNKTKRISTGIMSS